MHFSQLQTWCLTIVFSCRKFTAYLLKYFWILTSSQLTSKVRVGILGLSNPFIKRVKFGILSWHIASILYVHDAMLMLGIEIKWVLLIYRLTISTYLVWTRTKQNFIIWFLIQHYLFIITGLTFDYTVRPSDPSDWPLLDKTAFFIY